MCGIDRYGRAIGGDRVLGVAALAFEYQVGREDLQRRLIRLESFAIPLQLFVCNPLVHTASREHISTAAHK